MGYYSEVGLCLTKVANEAIFANHGKLAGGLEQQELYKGIEELFSSAVKHENAESGDVLYYWDYIKWYDSFTDIAWLMEQLGELEVSSSLFIRVGENAEDIEHYGEYWDNSFVMYAESHLTIENLATI